MEYAALIGIVSFIFFFPNGAIAVVSGECSDCHTMHNSQDGVAVTYELNTEYTGYETVSTPKSFLLKSDCAGCHSSTGTATIVNNTPIVFSTSTFSNPLAGGNFSYVISSGNDEKGHNVDFIKAVDDTLGLNPPGGSSMSSQLTCAGEFGCHGDRTSGNNYTGIKGAHHTDDSVLKFGSINESSQGSTAGLSYRFLKGIKGGEDDDWEQDDTNASHNAYKGTISGAGDTDTISYLCSNCHGNFHTAVDSPSPWIRHPTDVALPSRGEFNAYTSYSMTAPVARGTIPVSGSSATVTPGSDAVMCLSCHRAHASPYFKILRWDVKSSTSLETALSGCNVCHTSKN